jgi:hypothetical protein
MITVMIPDLVHMHFLACDIDSNPIRVAELVDRFDDVGIIPIVLPVWRVGNLYMVPPVPFLRDVLQAAYQLAYDGVHVEELPVLICLSQRHAEDIASIFSNLNEEPR